MHLTWLGLSAFKVESKDAVLVTDPFAPPHVKKALRAKADLVTVSNPEDDAHNHVSAILGSPFVIDTPGEFEVKGVYVRGIGLRRREAESTAEQPRVSKKQSAASSERAAAPSTVFTFDLEGMRLAHLGDLRSVPPAEVLEQINGVDLLFIPVGGGTTLEPDAAMKVVNAVEPRIVVPMHFQSEGLRDNVLPADDFLREIGASKVEPLERATIKKRDLTVEGTTVMLFRASGA